MNQLHIVMFGVVPYIAAAIFVVGHVWRYRYDKFGWTTRSSEVYEKRLLRIGSPLFHFGILMVAGGHVVGLLVPREWLSAIGIDEHAYHLGAMVLGTIAAVMTLSGLVILVYRRRTTRSVFLATTVSDKVMFVVLGATLLFGTAATVLVQIFGGGYEYRGTISPWFRSLIVFQPDIELMSQVPGMFTAHIMSAMVLFAMWPFTRLVHVWSAPIGYLVRPYVVYRSRDPRRDPAARPSRPG
ncbi:MAG: respiratory nitrate reductase subunit gamma, partial [Salana multivorans]|nr:respiratory nitrate reductase subunit gamma [Salana multivorans]